MPALRIERDDLGGADIRALLEEHLRHMHTLSPRESVHALDVSGLQAPDISFWCVRRDDPTRLLLGCGALKVLDARHGEIKSMRTASHARRQGVARAMVAHLVAEARSRGLERLSLETGSQPGFEPARRLYESFGFETCGPFAGYVPDPNSVFMTRSLAA